MVALASDSRNSTAIMSAVVATPTPFPSTSLPPCLVHQSLGPIHPGSRSGNARGKFIALVPASNLQLRVKIRSWPELVTPRWPNAAVEFVNAVNSQLTSGSIGPYLFILVHSVHVLINVRLLPLLRRPSTLARNIHRRRVRCTPPIVVSRLTRAR